MSGTGGSQPQLGDQAQTQQHQYVMRALPGGQTVIQQQQQQLTQQQSHYQSAQPSGNDQQWVVTRVRNMPGGPGQATQQSQVKQQQVFAASTSQSTTSAYGSSATPTGGAILTPTVSTQHVISTQPRLIPTSGVGQRLSGAGQSTTVVHFRTAPGAAAQQLGQQQTNQPPQILLTNPNSTSQGTRPIVNMMQQSQLPTSLAQQHLVKQQNSTSYNITTANNSNPSSGS